MSKHWNIQIDWFDSAERVLSAGATIAVEPGDTAEIGAMTVTDGMTVAYEHADWLIRKDRIKWNRRRTVITLSAGKRTRALTIDQRSVVSDEEATRWAHQVMEWLLADQTTELLNA